MQIKIKKKIWELTGDITQKSHLDTANPGFEAKGYHS